MANDKLNKVVVKTLKSNVVLGTEESSSIGVNVPKLPTSETFQENGKEQYGIFAVNYAKGYETISTLNSANEVVAFNYNLLLEGEENIIDETIFNAVANAKNITINEEYTVTRKYCGGDKIVLCGIVPQIRESMPGDIIVGDASQLDSVRIHLEYVFEAILTKTNNTATFKIYEKYVANDKEFEEVKNVVNNNQKKITDLEEQIKDATGGSITTINGGDGISVTGSDNAKTIKLDIDLDIVTKNEDGVDKDFIRIIKKGDQTGDFIAEVDASSFVVDGMLKEATYDESTHLLHLTWNLGTGDDKTLDVNLEDLVNITYTAGDGLVFGDNKFSVKVDTQENGNEFLSVSDQGIKVSGVQSAIDTAKEAATTEAVNTVKGYTVNGQAFDTTGWAVKAEHIGMTTIEGVTSDNVQTALESLKEAVDGGVNSITAGNGISVDTTNGTTNPTIKLHVAEGNENYLRVDENGVKLTGINDIKTIADNAKDQIDTFMLAADVKEDAVNTLKEIQEYISTHGEAAATMSNDIQNTKTRIAKVENDLGKQNGIATLNESGIVPTNQLPQLLELGDTEATAYAGNKGVELEKKLNELPNDVLFTYDISYSNPIRNGFTNTGGSTDLSSEVYWNTDDYINLIKLVNKIKEFGDAGYKSGRIKLHFTDDTHNEYYYIDMPVYREPKIDSDTLESGTMPDLYFINAGGYKMKLDGGDTMFCEVKAHQGEKWWEGYETVKGNQTGSLLQPGLMSGEDKAKLDNIDQYVTSISVDTNSDSELLRIKYNTLNPSDKTEATPSITIPTATPSKNGCMSAEDKEKLNNHDIFYKQERVILTYTMLNTNPLKQAFESNESNGWGDIGYGTDPYDEICDMLMELQKVVQQTSILGKILLVFTTNGSGVGNTSYYYLEMPYASPSDFSFDGRIIGSAPKLYLTNRGGYRLELKCSDNFCMIQPSEDTIPYSIMSGFTTATQDSAGLMTAADKKKLDGMSTQNASTTSAGLMSADDKKKLDSLVDTLQVMTQAEYDALTDKDPNKVYLIKGK